MGCCPVGGWGLEVRAGGPGQGGDCGSDLWVVMPRGQVLALILGKVIDWLRSAVVPWALAGG